MKKLENVHTGGNVYCDYFELAEGITLVIGDDWWTIFWEPFDETIDYCDMELALINGEV